MASQQDMVLHQANDGTTPNTGGHDQKFGALINYVFDGMKEDCKMVTHTAGAIAQDIEISFKDVFEGHITTKEKLVVGGVVAAGAVASAAAAELILSGSLLASPATEAVAILGVAVSKLSPPVLQELKAFEEGMNNGRALALTGKAIKEIFDHQP